MKTSRRWLCALAAALGCVVPSQSFAAEPLTQTALLPPVVLLAANTGAMPAPAVQGQATQASWSDAPIDAGQAPVPPTDEPALSPTPDISTAATNSATQGMQGNCAGGCAGVCSSCGQLDVDGCCPCCGHCFRTIALVAQAEATFFWPQFNREFLTAQFTNPITSRDLVSNTALESTEGSMLVAPRLTLGFQGECWGLVGRYWNATNWASGIEPTLPSQTGVGITNVDMFKAYTVDLEVQRRMCLGAWSSYGFFGVRHAGVDNDRLLNVASLGNLVAGLGDTNTTATSLAQFNGTGLTFGLWGIRPVCCGSPFSFFFANRYSYLFGRQNLAAQTYAHASLLGTSTDGAALSINSDLFIAELQLGLQWNANLSCLPGTAFARAAVEYQNWDTTGNLNASTFSTVTTGTASAFTSASADDILFNMFGLTVGAGLMF